MYNFGNIVCWRADGSLESFGRMDDQVKVKGFRVELDGVNAVTENFVSITKAASLVMDGILHGFYTSAVPLNEQELDAFVRQQLPYYSVPEKWIPVDEIPLNMNGKVDRLQLKELALLSNIPSVEVVPAKPEQSRSDSACSPVVAPDKVVGSMSVISQQISRIVARDVDLEKGNQSPSSFLNTPYLNPKEHDEANALPAIKHSPMLTWLRHRLFFAYRCLLLFTICTNIAVACWLLHRDVGHPGYPLSSSATATAANLCAAILIRSEPVINLLFTIFSSVSTSAPLGLRRICANVYHIGGIHVGCATSAIFWFIIFTVGATLEIAKDANARLSTKDLSRGSDFSTMEAYLHNPSIWLLVVATFAIAFPWLFLRRVAVRSEVLSSHAVRLHFDYDAFPGKGVRLAQHPLGDWHGFATFLNTNSNSSSGKGKGYSVIVSRAGDFTGRMIDTAPTHIWRRGIPTSGVLRIATLFRSVVVVATGSGIGPCLSIFPYKNIAMRILWTAPNHENTFGPSMVEEVRMRDPQAIIYNTRKSGKPDMSLLTYRLYKESGAEAVLVISNKRFTQQIVFDMEARGIPAYGAIFDS
ncbi:hypothetical protein SNOG_10127 [Parastagonospora nodorum SN15]|uniref:AMP-dependent synthetase/ligase domain-containing protein n=1 Tax=Phaeosphaeria nodorum (strain SN15 / ATCC MYA-4574 / FGSC 10173) TaxID=321614 RepID=Q0UDN7_PHANO|nr:hypothetical protein SNOG_10127 [Parastagonospora nodorum SN15]EAT82462.1 hypothetical protein SNOG_10127 [Parastagonospora nodorum SN15]